MAEEIPRRDHLTEVERAYLAGLIDGEGSICGTKIGPSNPATGMQVKVAMTNQPIVKWLYDLFGGTFYQTDAKGRNKAYWTWGVSNGSCRAVLEAIRPYVKVKRQQVEIGVKFVEVMSRRVPGYAVLPMDHLLRSKLADLLTIENDSRRGVA